MTESIIVIFVGAIMFLIVLSRFCKDIKELKEMERRLERIERSTKHSNDYIKLATALNKKDEMLVDILRKVPRSTEDVVIDTINKRKLNDSIDKVDVNVKSGISKY